MSQLSPTFGLNLFSFVSLFSENFSSKLSSLYVSLKVKQKIIIKERKGALKEAREREREREDSVCLLVCNYLLLEMKKTDVSNYM